MPLSPEILDFIREHLQDDPNRLSFQRKNYPDNRVDIAVEQIRARKRIKEKLPSWFANPDIYYPSELEGCGKGYGFLPPY